VHAAAGKGGLPALRALYFSTHDRIPRLLTVRLPNLRATS
jgi:hypothetical protein